MATRDVNKLLGVLFLSRDLAHKAHFKTRGIGSDAAHRALGDFYDAVLDKADAFAEAWMGCYDETVSVEMQKEDSDDIIETLRSHVAYIKANRAKVCGENETALLNMLDDVIATYYKALYRLTTLK
jgi:DNA-binding ferritin-like protein